MKMMRQERLHLRAFKTVGSRSCKTTADTVCPTGSPTPIPGAGEPLPQTGVDFEAPVDPQHPVALKGHLSKSVADGGTTTLDWDLTLPGNSH